MVITGWVPFLLFLHGLVVRRMGVELRNVAQKVLIVDDSRTMRAVLRDILDPDPRLKVVGEAGDPYEARQMIKALNPDVLTLDVEMPKMNGLDFLCHLMRLRPMPVVMISSHTTTNSAAAIQALSTGAVDCVDARLLKGGGRARAQITDLIYTASQARPSSRTNTPAAASSEEPFQWNGRLVLIGSSTGGVEALERIFRGYPVDGPPTVIAQHMPAGFLESFADRLNGAVAPHVALAKDGETIGQGHVRLAPGGTTHLELDRRRRSRLRLSPSTDTDLYVPAVDNLFASAEPHAAHCVAVVLTGMGSDGSAPLLKLRDAGSITLGQRSDTCVVDGMPRAARALGAVQENVALEKMTRAILHHTSQETSA